MTKPRFRLIAIAVIIGVGVVSADVPAFAADPGSDPAAISDDQAANVRQNCKQAQSVLQRLQNTDVATRVNRGRIYENLINRLITPFNNRVNVNRYDASALALATSQITAQFAAFKSDYSTYENSFSSLLSFNCEADPRGFYSLLVTTREGRTKVSDDIGALDTAISGYTSAFTDLRRGIDQS